MLIILLALTPGGFFPFKVAVAVIEWVLNSLSRSSLWLGSLWIFHHLGGGDENSSMRLCQTCITETEKPYLPQEGCRATAQLHHQSPADSKPAIGGTILVGLLSVVAPKMLWQGLN